MQKVSTSGFFMLEFDYETIMCILGIFGAYSVSLELVCIASTAVSLIS